MNWTIDKVKAELPPVRVRIKPRQIVWCRISGRLNQYASVSYELWPVWYFAWSTIVHALNNDKPLNVQEATMTDKKINDILKKRANMGDHNSKVILAWREKYTTPEKREQRRDDMIAKWLEREGVKRIRGQQ